ncbi:MAG: glycosyltransferase [Myxococcota bacterium]|nr:glycosyltransferase [Myxococcota bacterium]
MIPNVAHFIWLGTAFPWVYGWALRSAIQRGGFDKVVLHHTDDISHTPGWRLAAGMDGVEARQICVADQLLATGEVGERLRLLYERLQQPAARSNVLRIAVLASEGGVYLDTDIITLRSFRPLLTAGIFCGAERIALPGALSRTWWPHHWIGPLVRLGVRDLLRRLPLGFRIFKKIERFYPAVVNNAVLGAVPGHPLLMDMLEQMVAMPPARQVVRYALGTNLLEDAVVNYTGDDIVVHPPSRFYPLGPEISAHWFRRYRNSMHLNRIVDDDTVCVHWYASVRTDKYLPILNTAYVTHSQDHQLFSRLIVPFTHLAQESSK